MGIIFAYLVFFLVVYILAAEYLSINRSKGEVLVFQRGYKSPQESDEEAARSSARQNRNSLSRAMTNEKLQHPNEVGEIFHWKNVCYDITIKGEPRRILDNVSGWVKPSTLTALMVRYLCCKLLKSELPWKANGSQGATGAGKTTLLDVLANRVTMGVVRGDISINGIARRRSFQRKTGYVQQQDIHLPTSTVREAMCFSAELRQPANVTKADKHAHVEAMIELLEMESYADAVVGIPGQGELASIANCVT